MFKHKPFFSEVANLSLESFIAKKNTSNIIKLYSR